jgi:toxin ParE1/3/4
VSPKFWTVRDTAAANADFKGIMRWTSHHFGAIQAATYSQAIIESLKDLCAGPQIVGCKLRDDVGPNIYTLHVARKGRHGRHFLLFRADSSKHQIDILRILHDAMDLQRHLTLH